MYGYARLRYDSASLYDSNFDREKAQWKGEGAVLEIGAGAFRYQSGLTSMEIPEGVTEIGHQAFYRTGLSELAIPQSIGFICDSTFGTSGITLQVVEGSYAQRFAGRNKIHYELTR